jgi:hypothetical protein
MDSHGRAVLVACTALTCAAVTVAARAGDGAVRIEVTDRSRLRMPELQPASRDAKGGRGLQLVAGLAARWAWRQRCGRTVTCFELSHG